MNLEAKIKEMESCRGKNRPLKNFRKLLDDNLPQHKNLKKIQIAGTNGKGSTSLWLEKLLSEDGLKVGVFTSPHLYSHMERIRIGDELIDEKDWEKIYDRWRPLFTSKKFTMFEMDLWMALDYFIHQNTDMAILEAGMGGRLDATTALDYEATLVTSIGLDHMEYLGDTKEKIAAEKGAIAKPGVPFITAEPERNIVWALRSQARKNHAPFVWAGLEGTETEPVIQIRHHSDTLYFDTLKLPRYQLGNLALALKTLEVLEYPLLTQDVQKVIDEFLWPGRYQAISGDPYILVDGAHNLQGIEALIQSVKVFNGNIYFSALKEKETDKMIQALQKLNCPITLVNFECYRLADLESLHEKYSLPIVEMDAFIKELKNTKTSSLVCGSLYFTGEVLKRWNTK